MKITNLFKNKNSKKINSKIKTLDKKQLEKVIGGAETLTEMPETEAANGKRAVLSGHSGGWS